MERLFTGLPPVSTPLFHTQSRKDVEGRERTWKVVEGRERTLKDVEGRGRMWKDVQGRQRNGPNERRNDQFCQNYVRVEQFINRYPALFDQTINRITLLAYYCCLTFDLSIPAPPGFVWLYFHSTEVRLHFLLRVSAPDGACMLVRSSSKRSRADRG